MPRQAIVEREVAADLKEVLNQHIAQGGLPFEQVSEECRGSLRFPDIIVWTDCAARKAFALWGLKAPGQRAKENLDAVLEKAADFGVRYVVLWDFQQGQLCAVLDHQLSPLKEYPTFLLRSLEEWADPFRRKSVEEQAREILDDLARLARGEPLPPYIPNKFYFIGVLQEAIGRLVPALQQQVSQEKKRRDARRRLDQWAVQQGYPTELPDLDNLLARHWAYSLALRILFYFTVRRYHEGLPDLRPAPGSALRLSDLLWDAFSRAQQVNWRAVFERSPLDELGLPPTAEEVLADLLEGFHRYDFGQLKEDAIGQIMEGLISPEERHNLGQYFTREDLVDFILGFVVNRDDAAYLDPTCGSGAFLNRLYSRLRWLANYHPERADHARLLERLWGVDIAHFPAELATINLFRQNVKDTHNFPRIIVRDFFQVQPGQEWEFPPMRPSVLEEQQGRLPMPSFQGVVGNFPYIRRELIERQTPGYKREIVRAIARNWFWKDPDLFEVRGVREAELEEILRKGSAKYQGWLDEQVRKGQVDLRLSGQADIYAYLFYHAASFLEEGGRMGVVTSNAWLDVAYGRELKRFFLRHFKIVAVVASWAEPWFEDAAINTAFVVLERCESPEARRAHTVRFVKVKKPLTELLPQDMLLQEDERWRKVDTLVRQIETAGTQATCPVSQTGALDSAHGIRTAETPDFRIRLVPQAELEAELERKGEMAKWGLYIRAPQVYFDLLEAAREKLVPLNQVAEVRCGYTTGINDFFYLEPLPEPARTPGALRVRNARKWVGEIEESCLRPVVRSPREALSPLIDPNRLKGRLFLPPEINAIADMLVEEFMERLKEKGLSLEERRCQQREFCKRLRQKLEQELRERYPLAYAYVKWGENQSTPQGQKWPDATSVQGRRVWWLLSERRPGPVLMPKVNNRRFVIFQNPGVLADHNLFEFLVADEDAEIVAALMNSTLVALFREVVSRVNLGDGATKTEGIDWEKGVLIPAPGGLEKRARETILKAYKRLMTRPVLPIDQEVRQRDRQALDEAVLEALGLDSGEYLPRIYEGLVEMVRERLALPKMRKVRKKQAQRTSLENIREKVRQEILPDGLQSITAFLPVHPRPKMERVPILGQPLSWRSFLSQYELLDKEGNTVGTLIGEESQARYAVHAWRPGFYELEIPADPIVAGKAVQEYEQYLRRAAKELFGRLLEATRNCRQAEQAVREILESQGLSLRAINDIFRQ